MLVQFRVRALAAVAGLLIAAGCAGSPGSGVPQAGTTSQGKIGSFRHATAADKTQAQQRPSLQNAPADRGPMDKKSKAGFTFVTSLTIDNAGGFAEWSSTCKKSIWDAPWYWAEGDFSLPVADPTVLAVCTAPSDRDGDSITRMNSPQTTPTPSPTPVATPTPNPGSPTNLYIVKVDIGWWSVSVKPVSGSAMLSADGSTWTFPAMTTTDGFQDDHLYAFFVASWNGSTPPSP